MIKLSNVQVPAEQGEEGLIRAAAERLGVGEREIGQIRVLRRSVDARHKNGVRFIYTAAVEVRGEEKLIVSGAAVPYEEEDRYSFPYCFSSVQERPVVIGLGPAGMFAALCLAEAGVKCTVIERGRRVEERTEDVRRFWNEGTLDTESNVQFGEGGAGTFSDGKLTTGVNDIRTRFVLERLVEFGAPEDILYLAKPHIGTDRLKTVVASVRERLLELGCDVRFGCRALDITTEKGAVSGIIVSEGGEVKRIGTKAVILAPGNSSRDTFEMLRRRGIAISAKSFSVGFRIEHRQRDIDLAQYGQAATLGTLPASDYKLAVHLPDGRTVYTFCVCPGGMVVAAASELQGVVTNGMSEYARDGENCNGGLLVSVTPEDFGGDPMRAIEFQRELEAAAFYAGGEDYRAPAQLVGDFLRKVPSKGAGRVRPTYRPGVRFCNLWDEFPDFICESVAKAIPQMEKKIRGFAADDALLTAIETRSSSPVRIDRENGESVSTPGLFPCGEGAGYAGGIMSAAVDGIKAAERVCAKIM